MEYQRKGSADELLAGWTGQLDPVLYSPEVEEAIKEVGRSSIGIDKIAIFWFCFDITSTFASKNVLSSLWMVAVGVSQQQSSGQERLQSN